jgi:outer membrane receptor protein involved in Fe transport
MRFNQMLRGTASVAVLSAIAAGAAGVAHAAAPPSDSSTTVTEIVVTAQKREQNLQDVPVVVTALPARLLQDAGVHDIKDMQILTPGLTVTSTSNESITTARIRGVGTVGDNPGLESSVGLVIDGVYRPRDGVSFGDLGDLSRIEVLKGPQGTLFGKNTTAGVINILTKEPQFTFGTGADLEVGNYSYVRGDAWVTGPIAGDQLAGMLYFADGHRDGFYKVDTAGGPRTDTTDMDQDYWTVRGQLLWQPSDKMSLRIIGDYTKRDENCCVAVQMNVGPTAGLVNALAPLGQGVSTTGDPFSRQAFANRGTQQNVIDDGLSAEFNADIDGVGKLTSITAGRHWSSDNAQDIDYSGADILYRNLAGDETSFDTFSEELRLAGKTDRLDWLVGGFYSDERLKESQNYYYGNVYTPFVSLLLTNGASASAVPCLTGSFNPITHAPNCDGAVYTPGKAVQDEYNQKDTSWAFFTNEDLHVTDKFDITLGLRYTEDDKTLTSSYANVGTNGAACGGALGNALSGNWNYLGLSASDQQLAAAVLCLPFANPFFNGLVDHQSSNENFVGGTVKATYHWTSDFMTYVSYARGTKAGGFNLDRVVSANGSPSAPFGFTPVLDTHFPAEDVDSYEVGFKSTMAGGKLLFNATLFDQTYHHFQLNQFNGLVFVVDSIPEVTSKGVDADLIWFAPVDGLSFQGGLTYSDTRYNHFTASQLITPSNYPSLSLLPGARLSFAPLWSISGAITYDHEIADNLRLVANLDAKYMSDYNTGSDLDPNKDQPAYTLVNARVGVGSTDHRWTVEFWAENLTDVHYRQVVFDAPLQGQAALDPAIAANRATQTYDGFLAPPRTFGVTLRLRY